MNVDSATHDSFITTNFMNFYLKKKKKKSVPRDKN